MLLMRRLRRFVPTILFVLIIAIGTASVVSAPYVVEQPGQFIEAHSLLEHPPTHRRATVLIPTVTSHQAKWSEVALYTVWHRARLVSVSTDEEQQQQATADHGFVEGEQLLRDSQQIATLLAAQHVNAPVQQTGAGVRVWAVEPTQRGPLRAGDVIVRADDRDTLTFDALQAVVRAAHDGDPLRLLVTGDGDAGSRHAVTVRVDRSSIDTLGSAGVARALGVAALETDHPVVVAPHIGWKQPPRVAGTSAGLAFALAARDQLDPPDTDGSGTTLVVTGEIASDGGVYSVGGVEAKGIGARQHNADAFYVPINEVDAARCCTGGVEVVGIRTVTDALRRIERVRS